VPFHVATTNSRALSSADGKSAGQRQSFLPKTVLERLSALALSAIMPDFERSAIDSVRPIANDNQAEPDRQIFAADQVALRSI